MMNDRAILSLSEKKARFPSPSGGLFEPVVRDSIKTIVCACSILCLCEKYFFFLEFLATFYICEKIN